MSVAYILDKQYSSVLNSKLNQALEVTTSLKAPIHYVDTLSLSKTEAGNLNINAPVVECTQVQAPIGVIDTVNVEELIPKTGAGGNIQVSGNLDLSNYNLNNVSNISGVSGQLSLSATDLDVNKIVNLQKLDLLSSPPPTTNQVLSVNGSGNLYWKDDVSGDTSQWATFKAVQAVDMDNNDITSTKDIGCAKVNATNEVKAPSLVSDSITPILGAGANLNVYASTIDFQNGELKFVKKLYVSDYGNGNENQVLSVDALGNLKWKDDASGNVSDWANFPAVNDVDMNTFQLQNAGLVSSDEVKVKGTLTQVGNDYSFYIEASTLEPSAPSLNLYPPSKYGYFTLKNSGNLLIEGDGGVTAMDGVVQSKFYRSADNNTYIFDQTSNSIQSNTGCNIYGFGDIFCNTIQPNLKIGNSYYVSPTGNDGNNGSITAPKLTIQNAINVCSAGDTIYVMNGHYVENLNINKALFLKGVSTNADNINANCCYIEGDITLNITSGGGDMFNNVVSISGILMNFIEANSGCTNNFILELDNCYLYNGSGSGRLIHVNPNSTDCRLWLNNCKFVNQSTGGTLPLIEINKGMLKISQCLVNTSGSNNCLKIAGSSKVDSITLSTFTSSSASITAPEIVLISASGTPAITFGNCGFIYSSNSDKSNNINSCAVRTSTSCFVTLLYNFFSLAGTRPYNGSTGNYILKDDNSGNPVSQANILFFSNSSGYDISVGMGGLIYTEQANTLQGVLGTNKRSFQAIA